MAVGAMLDDLRRVEAAVARLHRIPSQMGPVGVRRLSWWLKRPRPRVVRHLNLSAEVGIVDNIRRVFARGDEGHRSAPAEVESDADEPILEKGHVGRWCRRHGSGGL